MVNMYDGSNLEAAYETHQENLTAADNDNVANKIEANSKYDAVSLADAAEIVASHLPVPIGVPLTKAVKIVEAAVAPIITDRGRREIITDDFYEKALLMRRARGQGSR